MAETQCKHIGKFVGLCLVDWDTGFCQQVFECVKCGFRGQKSTIFEPEALKFHAILLKDCIQISAGWPLSERSE